MNNSRISVTFLKIKYFLGKERPYINIYGSTKKLLWYKTIQKTQEAATNITSKTKIKTNTLKNNNNNNNNNNNITDNNYNNI